MKTSQLIHVDSINTDSKETNVKADQKAKQTAYVIGDGPKAHITSIKLKQKGMKNVVVIGMRFDAFTRSASFNYTVFNEISKSIAPIKIKYSASEHIKEAERQLHEHAKKLGITFICGKFDSFEKGQLKIISQDKTSLISLSKNDIVFDCTGTSRAVIKSINEKYKDNPIFKFTPIEKNPHKTYASIRMYYSPDLLNVSMQKNSVFNPVSYALAIEELRTLGWTSYAVPRCHHYHQPSKAGLEKKLEKYVLFFQIPEINLEEKKDQAELIAIRVAKILLKLFRKNPEDRSEPVIHLLKKSKKYPKKQIVSVFNVDPYQTTPSHYKGDDGIPLTFHLGDATLPMPFVIGQSLICGIERTNSLFDNMNFNDDGLIENIDYEKYDSEFSLKISKQIEIVKRFFIGEDERIHEANKEAILLYKEAEQKCKNIEDQQIIISSFESFTPEYFINLFNKSINLNLGKISDEKMGFNFTTLKIDYIFQQLNVIVTEFKVNRNFLLEKKHDIKDMVLKIIDYTKKAGNYFFLSKQYSNAISFFEIAEGMFKEHLNLRFPNQLLQLYSILIMLYMKNGAHDKVVFYDQLVNKIIPFVDMSNTTNKLIVEKLKFNKANSSIDQCIKYLKQQNYQPEIFVSLIKKANIAISEVRNPVMALKLKEDLEKIKLSSSSVIDKEMGERRHGYS